MLERVNYGNGAHVEHEYDDDQRLLSVEHYDAAAVLILGLGYQYNTRDLPVSITESNGGGTLAVVGFEYDNRGRLIGESRTGAVPYDLEYSYDQAGNRTSKMDNVASLLTLYEYDVDDPVSYQSDNNRLMKSETYDVAGTPVLVSTTWYYYVVDRSSYSYDEGNVNRIVTVDHTLSGTPHYTCVRMEYDKAQRVSFMLGEEWDEDGPDGDSCPDNYTITWAREFRYDAARARYLNRELDPGANGLMHTPYPEYVALSESWTDYDGDESYNDFEIAAGSPPTIDNLRSFEPGLSAKDPDDQPSGISYYHSDMLGTTRTMSDSAGTASNAVAYTAFGERIDSGTSPRYGYAGSWGYQSNDFPSGGGAEPIPFLHVGWRFYDPGTGRFLQRDPIGIAGGLNIYAYVSNVVTSMVDPLGLEDEGAVPWPWGQGPYRPGAPPEELSAAEPARQFAFVVYGSIFSCGCAGRVLPYATRYLPLRYQATHAIPRLVQNNLTHTVVQNAVRHGTRIAGNQLGRSLWCYENVRVVTNYANLVITAWKTSH
ncbi:MAG: RHS repeat-associated core domain-containing protein [Phycisphaerales bacterium]|nr:RHS repeat-associated core domain-containing protein [Phycisphaerales bacterium]